MSAVPLYLHAFFFCVESLGSVEDLLNGLGFIGVPHL